MRAAGHEEWSMPDARRRLFQARDSWREDLASDSEEKNGKVFAKGNEGGQQRDSEKGGELNSQPMGEFCGAKKKISETGKTIDVGLIFRS